MPSSWAYFLITAHTSEIGMADTLSIKFSKAAKWFSFHLELFSFSDPVSATLAFVVFSDSGSLIVDWSAEYAMQVQGPPCLVASSESLDEKRELRTFHLHVFLMSSD